MKKVIASILAAGAASLAIAGTANAAEPCPPAAQAQVQVQPSYYGENSLYGENNYQLRNFRERERFERMQARRRFLARLRHERMERLRERGYYGW